VWTAAKFQGAKNVLEIAHPEWIVAELRVAGQLLIGFLPEFEGTSRSIGWSS
jgi:hypothetical protein